MGKIDIIPPSLIMKAIVYFPKKDEELSDIEAEDESTVAQSFNTPKEFIRVGRFETFINLTNALLGAGIVNIPSTFVPLGLFPTVLSLLIVCFLCHISSNTMIILESGLHVTDISHLALVIFGRVGEIAAVVLSNLFTFSCTASYLMIGTDQVRSWLSFLGVNVSNHWYRTLIAGVYSLLLPVALTIPRKTPRFLSSLCYLITAMIIAYCVLISEWSIDRLFFQKQLSATAKGLTFNANAFTAISIHVSTFALPLMMLPIVKHYNPSTDKRKAVTGMVYIFNFVLVIISGCFSYLICGDKTKADFLMSFDEKIVMIIILQVAIFIVVTLTYPFVIRNIMFQWAEYFFGVSDYERASKKQRLILIPVVNLINVALALFISDSSVMLGFGGALPGCLMCFAFPSLCYLKTTNESFKSMKSIGHIIFVIFGILLGCICTVFNVIDLVNNAKSYFT